VHLRILQTRVLRGRLKKRRGDKRVDDCKQKTKHSKNARGSRRSPLKNAISREKKSSKVDHKRRRREISLGDSGTTNRAFIVMLCPVELICRLGVGGGGVGGRGML